MTPQSLSIADLKAVIDYVRQCYKPSKELIEISMDCNSEIYNRIIQLLPPTEPKKEEK